MNRLKFRVWDEKISSWDSSYFMVYPNEEVLKQGKIIQQFTGLRDKNGKDIYEGDFVRWMKTEYEVIWKEHGFNMIPVDRKDYLNHFFVGFPTRREFNESEVIGNIFENKKLLK